MKYENQTMGVSCKFKIMNKKFHKNITAEVSNSIIDELLR